MVCDFESFVPPADDDDVDAVKATKLVDIHNVCGFACYRVIEHEKYRTDPVVYSGPNVIDKFYEHTMNERLVIKRIVTDEQGMEPMMEGRPVRTPRCRDCVRSV